MKLAWLAALALAAGCGGKAPLYYGASEGKHSAALVGLKIITPEGETQNGSLRINLESASESYRLSPKPGDVALLRIKPGDYRLMPSRGLFGGALPQLRAQVGDRSYVIAFPRELARREPYRFEPDHAVALGMIELRLLPPGHEAPPEPKAVEDSREMMVEEKPEDGGDSREDEPVLDEGLQIEFRLDDSVAARRQLIQSAIAKMTDFESPNSVRDGVMSWVQPLQRALVDLQGEKQEAPLYKPSK